MSDTQTKEKTLWFMFFRAMVSTFLLAITLIYQIKDSPVIEPPELLPIYSLIGLTFGITILFTLIIDRIKDFGYFIMGQIAYDILFITALIYITGTQEAVFTFLYLITIAFASFLFSRNGALYAAAFSSICFSLLLIFDPIPNQEKHLLTLFFNNVAFFLVALLSGYISDQIRQFRSRLKEEQESVRELEDLNKTIINNMKSGLLTTDLKNQIIYFNPMAEKITGLSLAFIYKKNVFDIFPELKKHWIKVATTKNKKRSVRKSFTFKKNDNEDLTIGFSLSPLTDANHEKIGHILIFEDLTHILELEQEIQRSDKLAAVGKLAAGIAHEIRNPLASVSGSIEMLSRDLDVKGEDKRLMNIVLKETDRLNVLVSEFLDYVRPTKVDEDEMDVNELLADTILALSMDKKISAGVEVDFKPASQSVKTLGNKVKIKQVFWNLLINAHHAIHEKSESGKINIHTDVEHEKIKIEITDSGVGIQEETIKKIFDPFFTTKPKGTGLGLSVVHKIIESHKGNIVVNSKKGEGTTFTISLPNIQ